MKKCYLKPVSVFIVSVMAASFLTAINAADNSVVPIDWSRFTAAYPNDAPAELQKVIANNAVKFALNGWYTGQYGSQPMGEYYLDIVRVPGPNNLEFKVRGPAMQAQGIATVIKLGLYDAEYTGMSEQAALDICAKLVRSVAKSHKVNTDGGWGNDWICLWQGDLWAAVAGQAGWLIWEQFSDADKELIRKMVEWEANRRMDGIVPYLRKKDGTVVTPGDTKAEENAWNSNALFVACAMMPHHEHYEKWYKKAVELVISAYSHPQDVNSEIVINGKPLKEWLNGSNTEDNYAVVNHEIIHPDYSASAILNLWNASILTLGGKPVPEGVFFNIDKIYHALVNWKYASPPYAAPGGTIYQPDNVDFYFPQGNDWGPRQYQTHGTFSAVIHSHRLDTGLALHGAYWEKLYSISAKEIQDRFDDGHMYADDKECTYMLREEQVTHETALAIWAKWAVRQKDFKITKDVPK